MRPDRDDIHADLGPYALGALDPAERRLFEDHLRQCPSCAAEYEQLNAIPGLVEPDGMYDLPEREMLPDPDETRMRALLDRLRDDSRRSRRRTWLLATTAAAAAIAATAGITAQVTNGHPTTSSTTQSSDLALPTLGTATNPAAGVSATVGLGRREWGTLIELRLLDSHGPQECALHIVPHAGHSQTVATWHVPAHNHSPIVVYGATDLDPSQIDHLEVRASTGALLLTIAG